MLRVDDGSDQRRLQWIGLGPKILGWVFKISTHAQLWLSLPRKSRAVKTFARYSNIGQKCEFF